VQTFWLPIALAIVYFSAYYRQEKRLISEVQHA